MLHRTHFLSALAGGLIAALAVSALPAIAQDAEPQASPGDPFLLGTTNVVNANTSLRGNASSNLVIRNTAGGVPLNLINDGNGKAPMKVDSRRLVRNLNVDMVDFRHANELIRVAGDFSTSLPDPPIADSDLLTATIEAPKAGMLVMNGSLDSRAFGDANDPFNCEFNVDDSYVPGSFRSVKPAQAGTNDLADDEDCVTMGIMAVAPGTYTVDFTVSGASDPEVSFQEGSMWVMWVPFDGMGDVPALPG